MNTGGTARLKGERVMGICVAGRLLVCKDVFELRYEPFEVCNASLQFK